MSSSRKLSFLHRYKAEQCSLNFKVALQGPVHTYQDIFIIIKNLQRSTLQLKYQASSLDIKNKYFANFFQIFKETIQLLRVWWVNFLKAFICNTIENLLCRRLVWGILSWSLGLSINSEIKITYWNIKRKTTYKLKRFINYMINAVSKSLMRFKLHVFHDVFDNKL